VDYTYNFSKIPIEKRTLGKVFTPALMNNPSLLIDIAKVFVVYQLTFD